MALRLGSWTAYSRFVGYWRQTACALVSGLCVSSLVQAQESVPQIFGPAVDWSLESQVTLRLEGDVNRSLQPGSQQTGATLGLDGGFTLAAEGKRSEAALDFGVARFFFLGADQPNTNNTQRLDPRFGLSGSYSGKTYTLSGDFGFDFQPTSFTQAEDTGLTNDETTQLSINYDSSLSLELDRLNQLVFSTEFRAIEFTDPVPDLVATRTFGADVAWERQLSETTTLTVSGGGRYFRAQNPTETKSQTFDFSLGLTHQRTRRHSFGLDVGVTAVRTVELSPIGLRETDINVGATGGVSFDYELETLNIGINLTQSVDPSATGALQSFTRLDSSLSYTINDQEDLGLTSGYFFRSPISGGGSTLHSFSVGPTYTLNLTEEAQLSAGYLFRMNQDSDTGNAVGHRVFLTLTQNFDVLP